MCRSEASCWYDLLNKQHKNMLAALTTTALETSITSALTTAEGLITAGFAVTALFILVRIIKKGAAKIG